MTAKFDHMMKSGLGDLFGRGATGNSHAVLTRAKIQIDDALGKVRAIEADQTRTRAEKSYLLKKLDSKLKETMARAQADLDSTLKADRQRVESEVAEFSMGKMTDEMALGLAIHLRQADLGERAALLAADPRFIHAANRLPESMTGVTKALLQRVTNDAIAASKPELKAELEALDVNQSWYSSLDEAVQRIDEGVSAMIDGAALATRFDESLI